MQPIIHTIDTARYARCVEASRRNRWEIERDVIRGRQFDQGKKFVPDALALISAFDFLGRDEQFFISRIQGRTYANMFGLVERFVGAKVLEISRDHWLGDQVALQALVRFADEELKHQELFRRIESMLSVSMPVGYRFVPDPNVAAASVLRRSTWSVLALTCLIELFTQAHYRYSIEPEAALDPLWKDVFFFHWKDEAQHAVLDELEWRREDGRLDGAARDAAVGDLIVLLGVLDGILHAQARADAAYFAVACKRLLSDREKARIATGFLHAYRWQYILLGVQLPHFGALLSNMLNSAQYGRVAAALAPLYDGTVLPRELAAA